MIICIAGLLASGATSRALAAPSNGFFGATATAYPSPAEFQRISRGGLDRLRTVVYWPDVEPSPGAYRWQQLDLLAANAAANGISLLPVLYGTPLWASGERSSPGKLELNRPPIYSAQSRTAWSGFVGAIARRYGSNGEFWLLHPELPRAPILDWQIWNEVNLPFYWGGKPKPRGYAALIRIAHRALAGADPQAKLVLAGLLPYESLGGGIISGSYLRRLYKVHGIRKAFDVVAVHPYAAHPRAVLRLVQETRKTLDSLGARKTPIWATEFGWTTGGDDFATSPFRTKPATQAHRVNRAYALLRSNAKRLKLRSAFYFSLADSDPAGSGSWQTRMGLFGLDGAPKPSWYVYARRAGGQP